MPLADTLKERMALVRAHPEEFIRLRLELGGPEGRDAKIIGDRLIQGRTLQDIAWKYDLTDERIRQIEVKAWRKFERIVREAADATR